MTWTICSGAPVSGGASVSGGGASVSRGASVLVAGLLAAAAVAGWASPTTAQLPPPDAFSLASGGSLPLDDEAGHGSFPANPASLAGGGGWRFAVAPLRLGLSLGPITGRDIARAGDGVLSRARREAWLERIGDGDQRGEITATLGPLAVRHGDLAVGIATTVVGRSRLPADAVELLLFGNAGRDGTARDLRLGGAALDGAVWTKAGLAWGVRPAPHAAPRLAVGARLHATVGHALLVVRDAGSVVEGSEATATFRLPSIATAGGDGTAGFGIGLDVGVRWSDGGGATGVTLRNAVRTFEWDPSALRYRAGEALIEGEGVETDFDARPVEDAPATLRALARRVRPARGIEIEHVRRIGTHVRVRVGLRERIERGVVPGVEDAILVGVEWDARGTVAMAAHAGIADDAASLGSGVRLRLGAWNVSGAWVLARGGDRDGSTLALSLGR